jgi:hypothetical protein
VRSHSICHFVSLFSLSSLFTTCHQKLFPFSKKCLYSIGRKYMKLRMWKITHALMRFCGLH